MDVTCWMNSKFLFYIQDSIINKTSKHLENYFYHIAKDSYDSNLYSLIKQRFINAKVSSYRIVC